MTYRQLRELLDQLTEQELDCEVQCQENDYGVWCTPEGIYINNNSVVLDDGLLPEFHNKITRES